MIGPVVDSALALMRANAESMMLDRCKIERRVSQWNEAAQKTVTTWSTIRADVPCDFDDPSAADRSLVTDETATSSQVDMFVPTTTVGIKPDDRITVTAIGPMTDPGLADAVLWVTSVDVESHVVERRVECRWLQ